jgi:hypothetical protein
MLFSGTPGIKRVVDKDGKRGAIIYSFKLEEI